MVYAALATAGAEGTTVSSGSFLFGGTITTKAGVAEVEVEVALTGVAATDTGGKGAAGATGATAVTTAVVADVAGAAVPVPVPVPVAVPVAAAAVKVPVPVLVVDSEIPSAALAAMTGTATEALCALMTCNIEKQG